MTDQFVDINKMVPITPSPELVRQWLEDSPEDDELGISGYIATQAARWGSDQELEACCEWLHWQNLATHQDLIPSLRVARRPRPLSLRELALASVKRLEESGEFFSDQMRELEFIRKALEQFND